ncbi:hypothetical protein GBAR_LOCUS4474 [Geodia barretti]|uniref:Uncharacterized protein n=1 Tax=Geodia barretti TaxID=519541 RepID=A0AA35WAA8_GEOBA|nr:hypothetical protein GBAR_LOCUS4474 [Geodia barretti]
MMHAQMPPGKRLCTLGRGQRFINIHKTLFSFHCPMDGISSDYIIYGLLFIHFTATTFSKRSMKGSQSGTPPDLTHNYETVLPNFKKPPAKAAALAQNYEIPLPKAATLPRDLSTCAGKDPITPIMKFSQSVKVRGSTPEAVYMNVKETPTGEDVCAMKPVEPPQTVGQGASLTHREAMGLCLIIRWLKLKWDQFPRVIPGQITNGSIYVATLKYPFSFGSIRYILCLITASKYIHIPFKSPFSAWFFSGIFMFKLH